MQDNTETLDDLGIEELDAIEPPEVDEERDELYDAAADAPPEDASAEAVQPAPVPAPVEPKPLMMTLLFEGVSVTITAKRGQLATIGKYAVHGEPAVLLGAIEEAQVKLAALEAAGVPNIKFPEPPKPTPAAKPATPKPAAKSKTSKPAAEKPPAPAAKPAAAKPAPVEPPAPPPEESLEEIQARYFGKMVILYDKRSGAVLGWADKEARTLEVLTGKGVESIHYADLTTLIGKSKK